MERLEWVIPNHLVDDTQELLALYAIKGAVYLPVQHAMGFEQPAYNANPLEQEHFLLIVYCPAAQADALVAAIDELEPRLLMGRVRLTATKG